MKTPSDSERPSAAGDGWTAARVAHLRRRWMEDGASAGLIGSELGLSRNAVIGKVFRQGWQRRGAGEPREQLERRTAKPPPIPVYRRRAIAAVAAPPMLVAADEDLCMGRDLPAEAAPVAFVDSKGWQCAWPIDPVETPGHARVLCCGAPVVKGSPYCAGHGVRSRRETPAVQVDPPAAAAIVRRFAA